MGRLIPQVADVTLYGGVQLARAVLQTVQREQIKTVGKVMEIYASVK